MSLLWPSVVDPGFLLWDQPAGIFLWVSPLLSPTSVGMNHRNESVTKFASLQAINPACEVPESIIRLFTSFLALDLKVRRSNCSLDHSLLSTMADLDRLLWPRPAITPRHSEPQWLFWPSRLHLLYNQPRKKITWGMKTMFTEWKNKIHGLTRGNRTEHFKSVLVADNLR